MQIEAHMFQKTKEQMKEANESQGMVLQKTEVSKKRILMVIFSGRLAVYISQPRIGIFNRMLSRNLSMQNDWN